MEATSIGTARIEYNEKGEAISASFEPKMKIHLATNALIQLANVKGNNQADIEDNANLVMATWFERTNEIELADRDDYTITHHTEKCDRYPSGQIKTCVINFYIQKIKP